MANETENLDRASLDASSEVMRMLFVSALAVVLLAGGVYWLHRVPAQSPAPDAGAASIQVQLLPTPDPTPYPLTADVLAPSENAGTTTRPADEPARDTVRAQDEVSLHVPTQVENAVSSAAVRTDTAATRKAARDRALKFQQALQRHIARYQRYPADARQRGLEGTVKVVFLLRRDGSIVDAWVNATSGQSALDREALATIRRAAPLPGIPSDLPDELSVLLPVAFELP